MDFCTEHRIDVISKGVRAADFAYEVPMAQMNRSLTGVDTLLLPTAPQWAFVSSSLVREVASLGGDVTPFLPAGVAEQTVARVSGTASAGCLVETEICERLTLKR